MAKIYLDKTKCIGCGVCVYSCPENFKLEQGKASVYNETFNEKAIEAAKSCPVNAITIKE